MKSGPDSRSTATSRDPVPTEISSGDIVTRLLMVAGPPGSRVSPSKGYMAPSKVTPVTGPHMGITEKRIPG